MSEKSKSYSPRAGDVVEITGHRVGEAGRTGEILEVIGESGQLHYRVRWEDGHESIFYPSSDAVVRPVRAGREEEGVSPEELAGELERAHVGFELIPHRRTMTAGEEAAALEIPREQVAKTLVLVTGSGYVRAVLPSRERLDLHKARELLGEGKATRLASEEELAGAYPMFELGAVPPFGGPAGDRTIVDRRLAAQGSVVIEAGSHTTSLRIATQDLLSLAKAELADLCTE